MQPKWDLKTLSTEFISLRYWKSSSEVVDLGKPFIFYAYSTLSNFARTFIWSKTKNVFRFSNIGLILL